jgi:hypothetical protein
LGRLFPHPLCFVFGSAAQNHVDDPLLAKRPHRKLELQACLREKEFGKPRRRLFVVVDEAEPDYNDNAAVPTTNNKKKTKKKRKTKPASDSATSTSSPGTTTKKKVPKKTPKKTPKKVTFLPELDQST